MSKVDRVVGKVSVADEAKTFRRDMLGVGEFAQS